MGRPYRIARSRCRWTRQLQSEEVPYTGFAGRAQQRRKGCGVDAPIATPESAGSYLGTRRRELAANNPLRAVFSAGRHVSLLRREGAAIPAESGHLIGGGLDRSEPLRRRQDPMAYRTLGKDLVHQMRSGFSHTRSIASESCEVSPGDDQAGAHALIVRWVIQRGGMRASTARATAARGASDIDGDHLNQPAELIALRWSPPAVVSSGRGLIRRVGLHLACDRRRCPRHVKHEVGLG